MWPLHIESMNVLQKELEVSLKLRILGNTPRYPSHQNTLYNQLQVAHSARIIHFSIINHFIVPSSMGLHPAKFSSKHNRFKRRKTSHQGHQVINNKRTT